MDEMGLQWKKMPERMYISREEESAPSFKAFQDHFTFLLGANLTEDCNFKPVMVYHTETPHALKGYDKSSLPVHWYVNSSGWMTGHIFQAYSKVQLVHEFKEYCMSQGLSFHILMVFNNAPAHSHVLQDLHSDIKFVYPLVPYPHTYIALYFSYAKVTCNTHKNKKLLSIPLKLVP